ncbi:MAG: thiol:disulfide interchange protein DsbA [Gammaproteobacteria bacterium]|nr:MAG: thiol:disulfide interchange protein DsbA [Gammaproteobacteria bacterium]TND02473.1 MAG: thiol:disulfide interchange protein DsbA [Gammaproteobacteria bacterium]
MTKRLLPLLFLLLTTAAATAASYEEGKQYQRIIPESPTVSTTDKIEVVELFWYGCPHCHRFEPVIDRWLEHKPANVEFVRLPVILNEKWEIHARVYYTAEALGVLDKTHLPLFEAIHSQRRKLDTEDSLMEFFKGFGVKEEDFRKTFHSFAVDSKVRRARELGRRYNISSTPSIVINGKYRTDPGMAQGQASETMKVVDFLVAEETRKAAR